MRKEQIFIVDDEPKIIRLLAANLKSIGYDTFGFTSGEEALKQIDLIDPDLILLDLMMPQLDGFAVLERLRAFSDVPVIIITARDQSNDKVRGLNLGADDYLTKPFALEEVFARVKAVLRRSARSNPGNRTVAELKNGPVTVNQAQCRVWNRDQEVRLTSIEYKLFVILMQNVSKVVTHEFLLTEVWGPEYSSEIEYLRVAIARLRQKLKGASADGKFIRTYPGIGYIIDKN